MENIMNNNNVNAPTSHIENNFEQKEFEIGCQVEQKLEKIGVSISYEEKRKIKFRLLMKEFGPYEVLAKCGGIKANDLFRLAAEEFGRSLYTDCAKNVRINVIHINMGSCWCGNYDVTLGNEGYKFSSNIEEKRVGIGSHIPCWGDITPEYDNEFQNQLKETKYRIYQAIMSVHSGGRITKFVADAMSPFCRLEEEPEKALTESSQEPWKDGRLPAWSKEEFKAINDFMEKSKNA